MKYQLGLSAEPLDSMIDSRLEGVGMIRSEYICRSREEYVTLPSARKAIYDYVSNVCRIFYPHEVWYRTTELIVPEINVLKGADDIFEEQYYIYGLRGVRRGLKYKDTFRLELQNAAAIAEEHENLHILFPYIYDPNELVQCIDLLERVGFHNKFGIMAEIPSAILLLNQFAELGISNITIGTNDLSGLTLGMHRNKDVNRTHPAVLKLIEHAIDIGHKYNVPISVGGYVTKELELLCYQMGADYFIVHYNDLPAILGCPEEKLPYLGTLDEIKKLTKYRRKVREHELWRKELAEDA